MNLFWGQESRILKLIQKSRHWSFETVFGTSLNSAAMVQKDPGHHFLLSWFWIQVAPGPVFQSKPHYSPCLLVGPCNSVAAWPPDIQVPFLKTLLPPHPPSSLSSTRLRTDSANAKPGERQTLPIKWWSFPEHCSSYISRVGVWAYGWSWSYIHTLVSGLFGTQIGHSRTLHTPSAREKRFELFFILQNTEDGCFWKHAFFNMNHLLTRFVLCVDYLIKNKPYLYCYTQNLLFFWKFKKMRQRVTFKGLDRFFFQQKVCVWQHTHCTSHNSREEAK